MKKKQRKPKGEERRESEKMKTMTMMTDTNSRRKHGAAFSIEKELFMYRLAGDVDEALIARVWKCSFTRPHTRTIP